VTGSVTAIPEPLTLLGAGAAITLGSLFKRRLSSSNHMAGVLL
jgi:hypothetical protein